MMMPTRGQRKRRRGVPRLLNKSSRWHRIWLALWCSSSSRLSGCCSGRTPTWSSTSRQQARRTTLGTRYCSSCKVTPCFISQVSTCFGARIGLHRSGTTLLAETLSKHPGIAGLKHQPGADARKAAWINKVMGEGIFLQTVYPKFGLDHNKFLLRKWAGQLAKKIPFLPEDALPFMRLREGVGRFALHPNHHLDDSSSLIVPEAQEHLFNEWALFWNLSRPVLLEKSPSNIVISPFLHRLWGLGLSASPARFIFVRRHPIPVALATQRRAGAIVSDLDVGDLVEHWVAAEERRSKDIESYFDFYEKDRDVYRVLDFEDMLQEPRKVLAELFRWLKLQESEELLSTFEKEVRPDQNTQYFKVYCNRLVHGGPAVVEAHHRMVVRWRSKVLAVSRYDLFNIPKICRELLLGPTEDAVNSSEKQLIQKTMSEEETFDAELASKKEI
eukprot:TRINITY_DN16026_c0_g1_i2.p1 TRINITY_DN16026_c0_g1~~TRINITY_DN16026_c0_g1_i2.p1  ORF type:complete len:443 (+),score=58.77 TRINITY_DN16026_c0_g1_i2:96-1424(+)